MLAAASAHAANTYTVTNTASSGTGSLAAAVASVDADTGTSGDTINFASGVTNTITLGSTLTLSQNVTITGPGANLLTISGGNSVRVFIISSGVTASISGLTIANGNAGTSGNGGGIYSGGGILNSGTLTVSNSTFSGNTAADIGGGINSYGGTATVTNSIVAGNTESNSPGDDCSSCTLSGKNLVSAPGNIQNPLLGSLQYNGGPTETMMPLTGSPALNAGSGSTLSSDQRGFPRPTGTSVVSDLGAVQTNYTAVQFVQQPGSTILMDAPIAPPVTLSVTESGAAAINIPVPLTLTATSSAFDIFQITPTITWSPTPPTSVVYGAAPITLSATSNVTGPAISYVVDAGPGTISGSTLSFTGAGTVVIEAVSTASNGYASGNVVAYITVTPAATTSKRED